LKIDIWKEKVALYKDCVTAVEGIAPTSITWAKKHVMGFSDEEIKLDLQQQRIEKAIGAELTNTATIITHTGLFDNIDKLYGNRSGSTETTGTPSPSNDEMGGGVPPPPPMGEEPGGLTPESFNRDNLKILLESDGLTDMDSYIDLSKGKNFLGEIENHLGKLLND
jgi:hypothetical protein